MPKIKEPKLKERLWKSVSNLLIDIAEHLPSAKRGILNWLQSIRIEKSFTTNARPSWLHIELEKIWISEIVPIEVFESHIESILNLIFEHRTQRFFPRDYKRRDELEEQLRSYKNKIHGYIGSNLGLLDFDKVKKNDKVDFMEFQLISYSGSHICLCFGIALKKEFKDKINKILEKELSSETILFRPRLKNILKGGWGYRQTSGEPEKLKQIQSQIKELKEFARNYITKYVKGLVFKRGFYIPSTELWITSGSDPNPKKKGETPTFSFWSSVGMRQNHPNEFKESKNCLFLYLPDFNLEDVSIKLLANEDKYLKTDIYPNIKNMIVTQIFDWIATYQTSWSLCSLYLDANQEIAQIRLSLFQKLTKLRGRKYFSFFAPLFVKELTLKRLASDCSEKRLKLDLSHNGFPDFENSSMPNHTIKLRGHILAVNERLRDRAIALADSTQQLLKTYLETQSIVLNIKTQKRILILTIVLVIFAVLSAFTNKDLVSYVWEKCELIISNIQNIFE